MMEPGCDRRHGGRWDAPKMRLNPEEIRVLQECNRESFYYRCIPMCATAMIATHYAVSLGYLRRNANYGSLFKVLGAGAIGYFAGKFSYRSTCEDKIMQLPNSQLADVIRRRRQGLPAFPEGLTMDLSMENPTGIDANSSDHVVGLGGRGTWEINTADNVDFQGMDDLQRPSMDNPMLMSEEEKSAQTDATYEALRKRNREDYEARHTSIYDRNRSEQQRTADKSRQPTTSSRTMTTASSLPGIRNKYGDRVE